MKIFNEDVLVKVCNSHKQIVPELRLAVVNRLIELGIEMGHREKPNVAWPYLWIGGDKVLDQVGYKHAFVTSLPILTLTDLYEFPLKHTITIDGTKIMLSDESFEELKKQLL